MHICALTVTCTVHLIGTGCYTSHVACSETIKLRPDLTYEEELVEILAREVKELRNKRIPWSKCCGETTKHRKLRGKVNKLCGNNTRNYSMKVISRMKFF